MNCLELERHLDGGALEALPAAALAHVNECARCTRALARARSLERQLERAFSAERGAPVTGTAALDALPALFTERVMARVGHGEARGVRGLMLPDALPWWVRAASEPSVALACVLSALLLWKGDLLLEWCRSAFATASAHPLTVPSLPHGLLAGVHALAQALVPGPQAHWSVLVAMLIGTAPVSGLLGLLMWRLGERIARPVELPIPAMPRS